VGGSTVEGVSFPIGHDNWDDDGCHGDDDHGSDTSDVASDCGSDDVVNSASCVDIGGVLYDADTLSDLINSYVHELAEDTCSGDLHSSQTVADLVANMDTPVWKVGDVSAPITVYQAACLALSEKRSGRVKDMAFDRMCRVTSELLLPPGNLYPRSKYLMERSIGCSTLDEVSMHVCPKECVVWGKLEKKQWKQHQDDECPICKSRRFKLTLGGKLVPQKVYFYFGVKHCIQSMFMDDDFVAARGTARSTDTYYTSTEAGRLYEAAGCSLSDNNVSAYTLGVDGAQLFQTKVHSMWLILLQCNDLPSRCRSQRRFVKVVGIIPGPHEPKNFQTYMTPIANEFHDGWCTVKLSTGVEMDHRFLLAAVAGDSPGVKKVTQHVGHSAYLGCPHCVCRGERGPTGDDGKGGGMYFPPVCKYGVYNVGERQGLVPDSGMEARVGDVCTKSSHEDMKALARKVSKNQRKPGDVGFKGLCVLARSLKYWDYSTMVLVPLAHAALCGVVKDVVTMMLSSLGAPAIKVIKSRAAHFTATCDIGRTYMCVVTKRGNMTMEHWLSFLEHDSVYIFHDVLPARFASMWLHLRKGLLYAFRKEPVHDAADGVDGMMEALHRYADELYDTFGLTACKYNLHVLLCQLPYQYANRGPLWATMEFWIEQYIQFGKSSVRYRATSNPELILVHDLCVDDALQRARFAKGVFRSMPARYNDIIQDHDRVLGGNIDEGDYDTGHMLLGAGTLKMSSDREKVIRQAFAELVSTTPVSGWSDGDAASAAFVIYKRADVRGIELLHSRMYKRNRTRVSRYIMAQYVEEQGVETYIVDVSFFVLATKGNRVPIRFAVGDISRVTLKESNVGSYWETYLGDNKKQGYRSNYGVRLDDMANKMIKVDVPGVTYSRFLEYANMSGTGRWRCYVGDEDDSD
jgi:hypothetical protein